MVDENKNILIIRLMLATAMEDIPGTREAHGHGTADLIRPVLQNRMQPLLCQAINNHRAQ